AHYQYSSQNAQQQQQQQQQRAQSSSNNAVQFAKADYYDPYRDNSQGQTLALAERPQKQQQYQQQQYQQHQQQTPPSPLMRAVRHSRPTTPQSPAPPSAQSSNDSLRTPTKPTSLQQPRFFSPQAVRTPQQSEPARFKPRSSTATEDTAQLVAAKPIEADPLRPRALPAKPRVASMYASGGNSPSPVGLHVEVARTPQRASIQSASLVPTPSSARTQPTSGLAHAAIRDLVDMRAPLVHRQPERREPRVAERNERSELIDFIERRRAQTVAMDAPPERSDSVSSKRSDSSERSFKRSTARLADLDVQAPGVNGSGISKYKHSSWYGMPGQNTDMLVARPEVVKNAVSAAAIDMSSGNKQSVGASSAALLLPPQSSRIVPRNRAQTLVSPTSPAETTATRSQPNAFARPPRHRTPSPNPYSRNPTAMSVAVQTMDTQPAKPTISRGVQVSFKTIHSDDAVLDLMRQMDSLRTGHANQITEYQEHVIDLELLSQDLQTEVDQLSAQLEAKEASHKKTIDEMRLKLEDTRQRVDRELGEVKNMHATKCNELSEQVTMLLDRCQKYRARLVQLGVTEDELLVMAAGSSKGGWVEIIPGQPPIEQQSIVDSAFIESQYVETRESSQEADYFRQLMDIEQSMENTTIALGFELKRTQAKYLQQAADFVREQMVRLQQPNGRSESQRISRSKSVAYSARQTDSDAPPMLPAVQPKPDFYAAQSDNDEPPTLPAVQPLSPVLSLTASLAQLGRPPVPPSAPTTAAADTVRSQPHRRIAGSLASEPPASSPKEPTPTVSSSLAGGSNSFATLPTHSPRPQDTAGLGIDRQMRGFDSEGRQSGLTRMVNPGVTRIRSSTITTVLQGSGSGSDSDSDSALSSPRTRRAHRSPLAAIASGFFASSQESMNTLTGSTDIDTQPPLLTSTLITPTKNQQSTKNNTIGFSTAPRKYDRPLTPTKSSTVHWPQQSRRSAVLDTADMTAEELLQSLKLPSTISSSRINGSLTSSPVMTPMGSLGRHSPLPRTASFTDIPCSPRRNRSSVADSQSSDLTLPPPASMQSIRFDPNAEISLNLGLDKPALSVNSTRRHRRGVVQRRRSRSVGTWDRATSSAIFASIDQQQ
ncbi:hypothetical protein FB639_002495, partial [Coemansia asiatica]